MRRHGAVSSSRALALEDREVVAQRVAVAPATLRPLQEARRSEPARRPFALLALLLGLEELGEPRRLLGPLALLCRCVGLRCGRGGGACRHTGEVEVERTEGVERAVDEVDGGRERARGGAGGCAGAAASLKGGPVVVVVVVVVAPSSRRSGPLFASSPSPSFSVSLPPAVSVSRLPPRRSYLSSLPLLHPGHARRPFSRSSANVTLSSVSTLQLARLSGSRETNEELRLHRRREWRRAR